jgi:hypothetical protein
MKIFIDHDYIVSQSLDYGLDRSITLEQIFINLMIQHRVEEVYSVDNTRSLDLKLSSEKLSATSTKFLTQQGSTVAHVVVSMNFNRKHVSNFFLKRTNHKNVHPKTQSEMSLYEIG